MKKKKMRNKTVSILMAMLLCVSSLTGCGSKSSDKMDKDGNITLNFWSIYPEGDANYDWFQKIIAEYEEEHTNVKINYVGISFWDYFTKITTAMTDP